jgi:hypothetical protein
MFFIWCERTRSQDNIKMNLAEICCGLDSSGFGQGPVTCSCEYNKELSNSEKRQGIPG